MENITKTSHAAAQKRFIKKEKPFCISAEQFFWLEGAPRNLLSLLATVAHKVSLYPVV
jgi:hypothetical protein